MLNVMKTIENSRSKINDRYDLDVATLNEVINNSNNIFKVAMDIFVLGYAQGQKALKAEQQRKKVQA